MTGALPNEPRLLVWLAHHHLKLGVAGVTANFTNLFLAGGVESLPVVIALSFPVAILLTGFLAGAGFSGLHLGLTCDYCMGRITFDGAGEAARHRQALRLVHRLGGRIELVLLGLSFLSVPVAAITGLAWLSLLNLPFFPYLVWTAWLNRVHSRLQPWCPQCRRRRGEDDDDVVPTPPPVPAGVAS